jgi:hypothetical protein
MDDETISLSPQGRARAETILAAAQQEGMLRQRQRRRRGTAATAASVMGLTIITALTAFSLRSTQRPVPRLAASLQPSDRGQEPRLTPPGAPGVQITIVRTRGDEAEKMRVPATRMRVEFIDDAQLLAGLTASGQSGALIVEGRQKQLVLFTR